jgi:hypothetical protein
MPQTVKFNIKGCIYSPICPQHLTNEIKVEAVNEKDSMTIFFLIEDKTMLSFNASNQDMARLAEAIKLILNTQYNDTI